MGSQQKKYLDHLSGLINDMRDPDFIYKIPYLDTEEKIFMLEETHKIFFSEKNKQNVPDAEIYEYNRDRITMAIAADISKWDKMYVIYSVKTRLPFISFEKYTVCDCESGWMFVSNERDRLEPHIELLYKSGCDCEIREISRPVSVIKNMISDWGCVGVNLITGYEFLEFHTEIPYTSFPFHNNKLTSMLLFSAQCNCPKTEITDYDNIEEKVNSYLKKTMLYVPVNKMADRDDFIFAAEKRDKKPLSIPAYLSPMKLSKYCVVKMDEIFSHAEDHGKRCIVVINPGTLDYKLRSKD